MSFEVCRMPDGSTIGYKLLGKEHAGAILVMVTGMSAVMDDWMPLAECLAHTRRVLVFDHRGMGTSSMTTEQDEDITIELLAQDVLRLCNALHVRHVHLLGFSMGGIIAQAILTHPDARATSDQAGVSVQGVEVRRVLLAATFTKSPRTKFRANQVPVPEHASWEERSLAYIRYILALQYHADVLGDGKPLQPMFDERMRVGIHHKRPQTVIGYQAAAISRYANRDQLRHVPRNLPIAVIHGRYDQMVLYEESNDILRFLPQAMRLYPNVASPDDREAFAHMWFDYFDMERAWVVPIIKFLDAPVSARM